MNNLKSTIAIIPTPAMKKIQPVSVPVFRDLILCLSWILVSATLWAQPTITGPTSVCPGSTHTYSYSPAYDGAYWSVGGGVFVNPNSNFPTSTSVNVLWTGAQNGASVYVAITYDWEDCETIYPPPYEICNTYTQYVCDWEWELQQYVNCRWESWQECNWVYPDPITTCTPRSNTIHYPVTLDPAPPTGMQVGYDCNNNIVNLTRPEPPANIVWYWQGKDNPNGQLTANSNPTYPVSVNGDYYIRALKNGCWSNAAVISVVNIPTGGSVTGSVDAMGTKTGSVTVGGYDGRIISWQQKVGNGSWEPIPSPIPLFFMDLVTYNYSVTTTMSFRAVIQKNNCNYTYSAPATITIYPVPQIISSGGGIAYAGGPQMTLSTTQAYATYQWYKNGAALGTSPTQATSGVGQYSVSVTGSGTSGSASATFAVTSLGGQKGINVLSATRFARTGITESTDLYSLAPNELHQSVAYQDGLGRTLQSIAVGQSPARKDMVAAAAYDNYGRPVASYLPYTTSAFNGYYQGTALTNGGYTNSEQYKFYTQNTTTKMVANDAAPFAKTIYDNSPLGRVLEQGAPGTAWQPGTTHTARNIFRLNTTADNVRQWTQAGPGTAGNTYYTANLLAVSETTDENGNKVLAFADKLGRTVLKRVQLDETISSVMVNWLDTYYVYDDRGNLAMQVPPKLTAMINSGTAWSTTLRDRWCFTYTYDERNRLVEKKTPDANPVFYGYDPLDRLVLIQDGNLRTSNQWMFIKYDGKGRPVMQGLYKNITQTTRPTVQQSVLDPLYASGAWYEDRGTTLHGYTNQSFPTANSDATALTVWTVNYYDGYDFDNNGTDEYTYTAQGLAGEGTAFSAFGLPTGSKRLVIGTSTWLWQYVFYDKYGRSIQSRSNNYRSAAVDNLTTMVYDFEGKLLTRKTYHNAGGTNQTTVINRYTYDHAARLLTVAQNNNSAPTDQIIARYDYNELGQLIDKKLHNTGGTNYLQSVDLRYNIRGWLRSINNAQLANDANVTNDDTGDYFGMELLYDNVDAGLSNTAAYNGNISAAKWKTMGEAAGTAGQRSYKYLYDKSDKLKSATFQAYGTTAWNKEVNTLNESQTYDHNGNILGLQRNQNLRGLSGPTITSTPQAIDNLTYTYTTGNQLSKVEDAVPIAIGMGDFKNNSNVAAEYTYNGLGSATKDLNKNITSITYNVLGKVQKVTYGGTPVNSVTYTYDARGAKLRTVTVVGSTTTTTDYIDGFVYTNNVLSFFGSPEGRVVKNGSALEYQYAIADHQGNTRVVFSSVAPTPLNIMATFEGDANDNAGQFTSVNAANVVTFVAANHTPAGGKVVRMNQSYPVGPAKNVKVYAGDKVDMEVWAYYEPTSGYGTGAPTVAAMVTAVATAFGGVSGGAGESGSIFNGVNSALTGFGLGGNAGDAAPAAYLNYILYDQQYKVVDMGWTRMPASANFSKQRMSIPQITVKEAGYVFVYLSYEDLSNNFVQFDDFKIVHTKSNLIQGSEYYAYGMQTASSWTRENATGNQFLYNGGTELNALTSLYDLEYRNFDPVLGRMHQVDPLADKYGSINPYNFALGNPAYFNDPSGADVPLYMLERRATKNADDTFTAGNQAAGGAGPGSGPAGWNSATYGSSAGAGGGTNDFVRLGPGDGGALQAIAAPFFQRAEDRKATGQLIAQAWNSSAENSTTIHVVQGGQIVASASALSIVRDMGNQALMSYYSNVIASTGIRGGNLLASLSYSIRTCPNCGVYPDGRTGVEPLIGGIIYEPTLTTSWFRFNEGFKLYYDKGYNNLIWNPLSPRTDNLSVVSKMTSPDRFAGFKNGYENGYNNGYDTQLRYLFITLLIPISGIDTDKQDDSLIGWSEGWAAGWYDRQNFYSNYFLFRK